MAEFGISSINTLVHYLSSITIRPIIESSYRAVSYVHTNFIARKSWIAKAIQIPNQPYRRMLKISRAVQVDLYYTFHAQTLTVYAWNHIKTHVIFDFIGYSRRQFCSENFTLVQRLKVSVWEINTYFRWSFLIQPYWRATSFLFTIDTFRRS